MGDASLRTLCQHCSAEIKIGEDQEHKGCHRDVKECMGKKTGQFGPPDVKTQRRGGRSDPVHYRIMQYPWSLCPSWCLRSSA